MANQDNINWLPQEEYDKAIGTLKMQLRGVFEPFKAYGLQDFIPNAINEAVKLCEDFGLRVRGVDKAISLDMVRKRHNGDMFNGGEQG